MNTVNWILFVRFALKKLALLAFVLMVSSPCALPQSLSVSSVISPPGTSVTAAGSTNSQSSSTSSVTASGTYTVVAASSGFDRYDVLSSSTFSNVVGVATASLTHSGQTPISGLSSSSFTAGTGPQQTRFRLQSGNTLTVQNSVSSTKLGQGQLTNTLSIGQAPVGTGSLSAGSNATILSPDLDLTSPTWMVSAPTGTGNLSLSLSNATGTFSRSNYTSGALSGLASGHRDDARIRIRVLLNGTPVVLNGTSTFIEGPVATIGSLASGSVSVSATSLPNVSFDVSQIYYAQKTMVVETTLLGKAYFGSSTELGAYNAPLATILSTPVEVLAVPEPASVVAVVAGIAALARRRRK